jgi:hypothetical protein
MLSSRHALALTVSNMLIRWRKSVSCYTLNAECFRYEICRFTKLSVGVDKHVYVAAETCNREREFFFRMLLVEMSNISGILMKQLKRQL